MYSLLSMEFDKQVTPIEFPNQASMETQQTSPHPASIATETLTLKVLFARVKCRTKSDQNRSVHLVSTDGR